MSMQRALACGVTLAVGVLAWAGVATRAQTPSAALLVVNKADNALAIVDPASGKVLGRVPVGDEPHTVSASADGRLAFVPSRGPANGSGTLSVIDVAARKELRRVDLGAGSRPHDSAVAQGKVFVVLESYKVIACYNPATNKMDWLLGFGQSGTEMLVLNDDVSTIFTANSGTDSVTMLARVSNPSDWQVTTIPVGKAPQGIALSPDGREVWAAHQGDGALSIIDVAARKVTRTLHLKTTSSNRLKFTPDGKRVLISDRDAGDLLVLDAAERREIKRMRLGKRPTDVLIEPGGARAYIAVSSDNRVAVLDLKTLEVTGHIASGANPEGMAWAGR